jgi:hypothetical protein
LLVGFNSTGTGTKKANADTPESNAQMNHGDQRMLNDAAKQLGCDV